MVTEPSIPKEKRRWKRVSPYFGLAANKRPRSKTLLDLWLKKRGISHNAFSRQVGCNEKLVDFWCDGQVIPSLHYALMVEKVTEGGVSAVTWLGSPLGRALWNDIQKRAKPQ